MKINGQDLRITPASFEDAMELQRTVGTAIKENKLNIDGNFGDSLANTEISPDTIGDIINTIINIGISKDVENALFKCAERALVGDKKVNRDLFEPVENREHYYPIMIEILKVNLLPFFKALFLSSGGLLGKVKNILKQKSE